MNKTIIKAEKLTRVYDIPVKQGWMRSIFWPKYSQLTAVDGVSFEINKGESVALLGPNGAGKTTTLKMMTGLLHPSEGKIEVLGFKPYERDYSFLRQIALVMGNKNGLSWDLSSRHGFELYQTIYDLNKEEINKTIEELAEILEVSQVLDRPVRKLSLGQRLKVELIGSILHNPKILFLDEPTLGLDIMAKRSIREFLKRSNQTKGTTLILTSHDMADIEKVSERVMVINQGKMVFDGSMEKLLGRYKGKKYVTFVFSKEVKKEEMEKYGDIIEAKGYSYTLEIETKKQAGTIAEVSERYVVDDIDIIHVPLEEIIADLFGTK
jgi:ABC-2 type transport system ATP-binding protein